MASLRDVARATGLSTATVSRALRGDPLVRKETRQRVHDEAVRLDYRFNPYVGQMMSSMRRQQGEAFRGSLAWVWFDRAQKEVGFGQPFQAEAERRALALGYGLSEFDLVDYTPARLARILKSRGIQGIIFSPPFASLGRTHLRFPVESFSCVVLGSGIARPLLPRIRVNHFEGMQLALHHARHRFGEGIAAIADLQINRRVGHQTQAAFLAFHPGGGAVAAELFLDHSTLRPDRIARLVRKHRIQCLITHHEMNIPAWMDEHVSPKNRIYLEPVRLGTPGMGYIDPQYLLLGRWGVEMVTGLVQRQERGVPEVAQDLFISPVWRPL